MVGLDAVDHETFQQARWLAVYGAFVAAQAQQKMNEGRGAPDQADVDRARAKVRTRCCYLELGPWSVAWWCSLSSPTCFVMPVGCDDRPCEGAERGWRDAKAYEESRWPKDPPAEIRYSERPHLENDCGNMCARYVLVKGSN